MLNGVRMLNARSRKQMLNGARMLNARSRKQMLNETNVEYGMLGAEGNC